MTTASWSGITSANWCIFSDTPRVWGGGWVGDEHLVDVHIAHLRAKLGDDAADPRYILTVRGVGYRMGPG